MNITHSLVYQKDGLLKDDMIIKLQNIIYFILFFVNYKSVFNY